ncbi:hypothetical protein LEP1GSC058_2418 [Leptospira fainei serovar Hurstbridge str. BUT 6]|uniref:Uncharacterized protein n=1 Tax=Leptospira fainei serovar Hurstbridge str. BUT 6 TaxID=1193011 RepID=S3VCK1_9LEPT|nr:hypothetical protein [Leptospira fainei]EPG74200.1 hypothetical protein LEP1GSC058_2418 [Leptospira fainei serovar Hurstbridge str. BUT 6]
MKSNMYRLFASAGLILSILMHLACSFDKRIEFSQPEKLALEADGKSCASLGQYNRWYAFYGMWKFSSAEPALPKQEGKIYILENKADWQHVALSLLLGVMTSISVHPVKISECDTTTRFVHKDEYDTFFENEREKARSDFFAESERLFEDSLRKYLDRSNPGDSAGKNYSTIIYRNGRIQEARVLGQDVDSIKIEWDESDQIKEASVLKKEIYKVIFATKVIRVKDKPSEKP